ncbi:MAG: hypothetical protein ACOC2R_09870 [Spirochaetota bacterium]
MKPGYIRFERLFLGIAAIATGIGLAAMAAMGPLWLGIIQYRTSPSAIYQFIGQDMVNLFIMAPVCIIGGVLRLLGKGAASYLLILTPLYLIYTILSFGMGMEWSHPAYSGNSEQYFFLFLGLLIGGFLLLFDSLGQFSGTAKGRPIKTSVLLPYSMLFSLFLILFALMWVGEVFEVMRTGTTRGYEASPLAFWLVRYFDLGFTAPLGFLSIYLLWSRPATGFPVQLLFYGFFLTMGLAVNAMGLAMYLFKDPNWTIESTVVFGVLLLIISAGFALILTRGRERASDAAS